MLFAGRLLVAAQVSAPQSDGHVEHYRIGRLSSGVFDDEGKLLGEKLWPIAARDVETFADKKKGVDAAIFHTLPTERVVSPTRAYVLAVDKEAHRVTLRSSAGVSFDIGGVRPLVESGDVLTAGETIGETDRRGLMTVDSAAAIAQLVTREKEQPSEAAAGQVGQYLRQLDFVLHGPTPSANVPAWAALDESALRL
jgi:hypothetical protein